MELTIGTRGSRLAVAQAQWTAEAIGRLCPGVRAKLKIFTTRGDRIPDRPLSEIGGKGIFTEAIENALAAGEADLAVHSLKDLPSEMDPGFSLACVPAREDPRDAMVFREGVGSFGELPEGARIGCGSIRRVCQLLRLRPDLAVVPIRGNIDTRLKKLESEGLDAVVLAAAGLRRLGLGDRIGCLFSVSQLVPACAQGALGLEIRSDRTELRELLSPLSDPQAERQIAAERAFLAAAGGGCHLPVGAFCAAEGDSLRMTGLLGTPDGRLFVTREGTGRTGEEAALGVRLCEALQTDLKEARDHE